MWILLERNPGSKKLAACLRSHVDIDQGWVSRNIQSATSFVSYTLSRTLTFQSVSRNALSYA